MFDQLADLLVSQLVRHRRLQTLARWRQLNARIARAIESTDPASGHSLQKFLLCNHMGPFDPSPSEMQHVRDDQSRSRNYCS